MCFRERPRSLGRGPIGPFTLVATTTSARPLKFAKGAAENLLARTIGVHVGCIEEINAGVEGRSDDVSAAAFVDRPSLPVCCAEGHCAQTEVGNLQTGTTQPDVMDRLPAAASMEETHLFSVPRNHGRREFRSVTFGRCGTCYHLPRGSQVNSPTFHLVLSLDLHNHSSIWSRRSSKSSSRVRRTWGSSPPAGAAVSTQSVRELV